VLEGIVNTYKMKKIIFLNILILLGLISVNAQQYSQLDFGKQSNADLFDKDWSSFDNLISANQRINQDSTYFQFDFQNPLTDLTLNDRLNSETSKGKAIEMPIFEPSANHSMKIYQPDSTSHYHLRIIKQD